MSRNRRIILSAIAGGLVALAAVPAAASATIIVTPGSLTFPQRQVATESDPQTVTVNVFCTPPSGNNMGMCGVGGSLNDGFTYNPQFVGNHPQDFSATNVSCPVFLPNNGIAPGVCQFTVRFKPTAPGDRTALLIPGTGQSSNPNPVTVTGSAVPAPVVTPTPTPTPAPAKKKKKCKKKGKKAGAAAKKCKKKKK